MRQSLLLLFLTNLFLFSCKSGVEVDPNTNKPVNTPTTPTTPTTPATPVVKTPDQTTYTFSTLAGGAAGSTDGGLAQARFSRPGSLAIDGKDRLYVMDRGNNLIRVIAPDGTVSTVKDASGKPVLVAAADGFAVDADGTIYLTEGNSVTRISAQGVKTTLGGLASGLGSGGYQDGKGTGVRFNQPRGLLLTNPGELLVADLGNYLLRQISADGTVSTFAGVAASGGSVADGPRSSAKFNSPFGLAMDGAKNVYVTEYFGNTVRKITPDGTVSTLAGSGVAGYREGSGTGADLNNPQGLFATKDGYLFVAEQSNAAIRLVTPAGKVSTIYKGKESADGFTGVVADSKGVIYFTEPNANSVHKLTP
jgi:sugar lactone lactonase YvrE